MSIRALTEKITIFIFPTLARIIAEFTREDDLTQLMKIITHGKTIETNWLCRYQTVMPEPRGYVETHESSSTIRISIYEKTTMCRLDSLVFHISTLLDSIPFVNLGPDDMEHADHFKVAISQFKLFFKDWIEGI